MWTWLKKWLSGFLDSGSYPGECCGYYNFQKNFVNQNYFWDSGSGIVTETMTLKTAPGYGDIYHTGSKSHPFGWDLFNPNHVRVATGKCETDICCCLACKGDKVPEYFDVTVTNHGFTFVDAFLGTQTISNDGTYPIKTGYLTERYVNTDADYPAEASYDKTIYTKYGEYAWHESRCYGSVYVEYTKTTTTKYDDGDGGWVYDSTITDITKWFNASIRLTVAEQSQFGYSLDKSVASHQDRYPYLLGTEEDTNGDLIGDVENATTLSAISLKNDCNEAPLIAVGTHMASLAGWTGPPTAVHAGFLQSFVGTNYFGTGLAYDEVFFNREKVSCSAFDKTFTLADYDWRFFGNIELDKTVKANQVVWDTNPDIFKTYYNNPPLFGDSKYRIQYYPPAFWTVVSDKADVNGNNLMYTDNKTTMRVQARLEEFTDCRPIQGVAEGVSGFGMMFRAAAPEPEMRSRCIHLEQRTEFRAGCSGWMCEHKCALGLKAVPGKECQTCPSYEPDPDYLEFGSEGWLQ